MHGGTQRGAPDRVQTLAATVVLGKNTHMYHGKRGFKYCLVKKKRREKKNVLMGGGGGGGCALMGLFLGFFLMLSVLRGYCENLSYWKKMLKSSK